MDENDKKIEESLRKWVKTREYLGYFNYVFLFAAIMFVYGYAKKVQILDESYLDIKLKIDKRPFFRKGKNPTIDFTAVGIPKIFRIRETALEYTRIQFLLKHIHFGDTVVVKMLYSEYFDIDREVSINNFNEVYGFRFKGQELIEFKKVAKREGETFLVLCQLSFWISLVCIVYRRFDIEPPFKLDWCIYAGCLLIMYVNDWISIPFL
jgi:hypothetical protein